MRYSATARAIVLAGLMLLAACGGDDGDAAESGFDAAGAAQSSGSTGAVGQATTDQGTGATSATPLETPRDVIYTATLQLTVDDADAVIDAASARVATAGGYLFSRQSSTTDTARRAVIVFKVPPDVFLSTLDALADLGDEQGRRVQADDVSAQVVDLESRRKTAQASVDRTRELLARAASITDIVTIERELASRETVLEQIQGQIRVLRGRVDAGTITVELATSSAALDRLDDEDEGIPSPIDGLKAGGRALAGTARVVALVLAALVPWLPVILVVAWAARFLRRRNAGRRRPLPPAPWPATVGLGARPPSHAAGTSPASASSGLPPPGPPPGASVDAEPPATGDDPAGDEKPSGDDGDGDGDDAAGSERP